MKNFFLTLWELTGEWYFWFMCVVIVLILYIAHEDSKKRQHCNALGGVIVKVDNEQRCVKMEFLKD